jgi:hypothetical protein
MDVVKVTFTSEATRMEAMHRWPGRLQAKHLLWLPYTYKVLCHPADCCMLNKQGALSFGSCTHQCESSILVAVLTPMKDPSIIPFPTINMVQDSYRSGTL